MFRKRKIVYYYDTDLSLGRDLIKILINSLSYKIIAKNTTIVTKTL